MTGTVDDLNIQLNMSLRALQSKNAGQWKLCRHFRWEKADGYAISVSRWRGAGGVR